MSESDKALASARLRRAEAWVDLAIQGAMKIAAVASLIVHGFNLMRRKVRVSEANAASTRFVG